MGSRVSGDVKIKRQEIVGALRSRLMSLDEIHRQMSQEFLPLIDDEGEPMANPTYFPNPKTKKPFDRSVIARDIDELREASIKRAGQSADEFRAEYLSLYVELYRIAMKQKHYGRAESLVDRMVKLTGASRPEKKEIRWDDRQLETMQSAKQTLRDKLAQVGLQSESAALATQDE